MASGEVRDAPWHFTEDDLRQELQFFIEMELMAINDRMQTKLQDLFKHRGDPVDSRPVSHRASAYSERKSVASRLSMESAADCSNESSLLNLRKRKTYHRGGGKQSLSSRASVRMESKASSRSSEMRTSGYVVQDVSQNQTHDGSYTALLAKDSEVQVADLSNYNDGIRSSMASILEEQEKGSVTSHTSKLETMEMVETGGEDEEAEPVGWLKCIVTSMYFEGVIGVFILANAILLGMQADYCARFQTTQLPYDQIVVNRLFCLAFVVEQTLKIVALGPSTMFYPEEAPNYVTIADFLLVALQVCDEFASDLPYVDMKLQMLTCWRVVKLIRILRVLRLFRFFSPLRSMMVSIVDSLKYFFWAMVLLMLLTYMFSVFLTQVATDTRIRTGERLAELTELFGSLDRSFLTLYKVISDGIHWGEVLDPLKESCPPFIVLTFVTYISFALFVLMNIITSSFVEGALRTGEEDRKAELLRQMQVLILEADEDGSGTISWSEFEAHLTDPQMQVLLKAIDFDQDEARSLFRLLDVDDSGEIDADDFVSGCLRLQGFAKAVEMAAFMSEYERFVRLWKEHAMNVDDLLMQIRNSMPGAKAKYSSHADND
eukprot:TRINITY_DN30865_c0_g1_i1.p1 TRINITY_DN30865_c0_g1~~TRINITY_DN30865_c0_g1_i1.p1  ORF type:complete len:624 (-),score=83.30 TRINITY_DN30865_c0_g1_i1:70-1878(-)